MSLWVSYKGFCVKVGDFREPVNPFPLPKRKGEREGERGRKDSTLASGLIENVDRL